MRTALASCIVLLSLVPRGAVASPAATGPIAAAAMAEGRRLAAVAAADAQSAPSREQVELRWNELEAVLVGHHAQVLLADKTTVEGDVLVVRDDALVMDLGRARRSSTVTRQSVALIKLHRLTGTGGRRLGTTLGVISGLIVGGYVAGRYTDSAGTGIPTMLAITSGFTIGGYFAGRSLDRKITTIYVIP